MRTVAPTEEKVTFIVPSFVRNCSVEMLQGDTVLAIGSVSFQCKSHTKSTHVHVLLAIHKHVACIYKAALHACCEPDEL